MSPKPCAPNFRPSLNSRDGSAHNLNDYFDISATDVVKEACYDMTSAVFTQKLGVVIGENQLEEFFCKIPWRADILLPAAHSIYNHSLPFSPSSLLQHHILGQFIPLVFLTFREMEFYLQCLMILHFQTLMIGEVLFSGLKVMCSQNRYY